jgi:hypothetical protein
VSQPTGRPPAEPLSPEWLSEIIARDDAAWAGPWRVITERDQDDCGDTIVGIEGPDADLFVVSDAELAKDDAEFIAHARTDVPALLAEVVRLKTERDQFADRVDTLTYVCKGNKAHVQMLFGELQTAQARVRELEAAQELTAAALLDAAPRPTVQPHPHASQVAAALLARVRPGQLPTADTIGPADDGGRSVVVHLSITDLDDWGQWVAAVHARPGLTTLRGSYATALGDYCGVPVTLVGHNVPQLLTAAVAQ